MDKVVRAVDVGYGNTKYVTGVEGNALRCAHFASSAPVCASHEAREALGGKRRTVGIGIGDFTYEVGPDAHLAAEVYQTRQMHDGYCETPEYLALTRGALGFMKIERIDVYHVAMPLVYPFRTAFGDTAVVETWAFADTARRKLTFIDDFDADQPVVWSADSRFAAVLADSNLYVFDREAGDLVPLSTQRFRAIGSAASPFPPATAD